jgi:hypothetical protein
MTKSDKVIGEWIAKVEEDGVGLTSWEEGFIASLSEQFTRSGSISDRQEGILERIYANKTP